MKLVRVIRTSLAVIAEEVPLQGCLVELGRDRNPYRSDGRKRGSGPLRMARLP